MLIYAVLAGDAVFISPPQAPAILPLFVAAMPRVMGVLARAAPFHGPAAVASGSVSEEEATAIVRVQVRLSDR